VAILEATEARVGPQSARTVFHAWYVLGVLTLINVLSFMDRVVPYVIAPHVARELGLTDTQIGAIGSVAFTLTYSALGLPLAWCADRYSRKVLIATACFIWSAFTAAGGLAHNFLQLASSRFGVALGESVLHPAGTSMIADLFAPARRRFALSVFLSGGPLGLVFGLALGGFLADRVGWRETLLILAAPGVIAALLMLLTVREPRRGASDARPDSSMEPVPTVRALVATLIAMPVFRHLLAASVIFIMAGAAINGFTAVYLVRTFHVSTSEVGLATGLIFGLGGALGTLLGGALADRLARRGAAWGLMAPALALLAAPPFYLAAYHAPSAMAAYLLLGPPSLLITFFLGPVTATVQSLVAVRARAVTMALLALAMYGVGASVGGVLTGVISDQLKATAGDASLGIALSLMSCLYVWCSLHLWKASRWLPPPA